MIFSRNRGSAGKHVRSDRARAKESHEGPDDVGPDLKHGDPGDLDDGADAAATGLGPYDSGEAPKDGVERLDLGALHIPAVAGVEIRLQAGQDGQVQQVLLVDGDSALQLGVFAAPRSEGIWDEVREELRSTLTREGARPEETPGEFGTELRARVRADSGLTQVRFVGVDGPRWFVRAMLQGPAATDPERAATLMQVLYGLVVDRGNQAMPVREALPLRLPPSAAAQLSEQTGQPVGGEAAGSEGATGTEARDDARGGVNGSAPTRPSRGRNARPGRR